MSVTIVSTPYDVKSGNISVKPYFDKSASNMGLEKYEMSLYDGVFHEEQLALIERNGVKRYITGLNEFAPEVKMLPDDLRAAKVKDIRRVVAQLEKELASNIIKDKDLDSEDFWNKVVMMKPDNDELWSKITLRCGNQPVPLDPAKDPYDLIKLYAIEAGGFAIVASSYEVARSMSSPPKFYLDKYVNTISTKTEVKKIKNKALSELDELFNKNTNKLLYVAKVVDGNSTQYKKNTPNDVIYDNMDKFINGEGIESNVKRASESFYAAATLDMETLKLKAMIKDATFYKFIALKSDGFIYHMATGNLMGRTVPDCIEFLKNPLNDSVLIELTRDVEKQWRV